MALPIVGAAVAAAGSDLVNRLGEGLGSLFGGATATDKARAERTAALLSAALSGDGSAVISLQQYAFEKRPSDGKYNPQAVRDLAKKALQRYYTTTGETPPVQYAAALKIPVSVKPAPLGVQVLQPVLNAVGERTADEVQTRAAETGKKFLPYALGLIGIIIVLAIVQERTRPRS